MFPNLAKENPTPNTRECRRPNLIRQAFRSRGIPPYSCWKTSGGTPHASAQKRTHQIERSYRLDGSPLSMPQVRSGSLPVPQAAAELLSELLDQAVAHRLRRSSSMIFQIGLWLLRDQDRRYLRVKRWA
jgi:hypothetical protein